MELDEFNDGYFYKTKNYVLRELDGKITTKGNAFKSSKHSRIYEKAVERACKYVLDSGRDGTDTRDRRWDLVSTIKDWSSYDVTEYIKHITYRKDPDSYYNQRSMQAELAEQAAKYLNQTISEGDGIDYIVTSVNGEKHYTIAPLVSNVSEVYTQYYSDEVDSALKALGFNTNDMSGQMELF